MCALDLETFQTHLRCGLGLVVLGQLVLVKIGELSHHHPPQRGGEGAALNGLCLVQPGQAGLLGAEGLHEVGHGQPVGGQAHRRGEVALQVGPTLLVQGGEGQ